MLQKLSPRKAAGIDKITSQLLRKASPVIAPVVARLINFSFPVDHSKSLEDS